MNAGDKVRASNRRAVRYTYLRDAWPECPPSLDPFEAILAAPPDAIIDALTREVDEYAKVIAYERGRADGADRRFRELHTALRVIVGRDAIDALDRQLDLFDAPDDFDYAAHGGECSCRECKPTTTVPTGSYL